MTAITLAQDAEALALECDAYADLALTQAAELRDLARRAREPAAEALRLRAEVLLRREAARHVAEATGAHAALLDLHRDLARRALWREVVGAAALAVARWALR